MPDKTTVAGELPKLPVPDHQFTKATGAFSADQMHAYATAALAQKDGEVERLREAIKTMAEEVAVQSGLRDEYQDWSDFWEAHDAALGSQA